MLSQQPMIQSLNPKLSTVGLVKNTEADDAEVAAAKAFVDYLKTPEAAAVFEKIWIFLHQLT